MIEQEKGQINQTNLSNPQFQIIVGRCFLKTTRKELKGFKSRVVCIFMKCTSGSIFYAVGDEWYYWRNGIVDVRYSDPHSVFIVQNLVAFLRAAETANALGKEIGRKADNLLAITLMSRPSL